MIEPKAFALGGCFTAAIAQPADAISKTSPQLNVLGTAGPATIIHGYPALLALQEALDYALQGYDPL